MPRFGLAFRPFGDDKTVISGGFGMYKSLHLTERINLRGEATFADILNHTNLGDPNLNISSPSFGLITKSVNGGAFGAGNGEARTGQVSMRLDF